MRIERLGLYGGNRNHTFLNPNETNTANNMKRLLYEITERARQALATALDCSDVDPNVRVADEQFGDYQINGVMPLAKRLRTNPRELAAKVMAALDLGDLCDPPEIAGPGFINLTLRPDALGRALGLAAVDERSGIEKTASPQRIVLDYSSPNISKQMHVGHLRSTIIGDAIYRVQKFLGHEVTGDNHLGDWGTQFGLLIVGYQRFGDEERLERDSIAELEHLYREANALAKDDATVADEARQALAQLQSGDAGKKALWERFVHCSRKHLEAVYQRLDVTFDSWHGESFYHDRLPGVVERLLASGLAREDQGAVCVFFAEGSGLEEQPFLIRKSDGAFLYATTDLATLAFRSETYHPDRVIYVVDKRQSLHFRQLFEVAHRLGYTCRLEHVGFGTILGEDGRPIKTREGAPIQLTDLLDEAHARALELVKEKWPQLPNEELAPIAEAVGIGAVKYADLSQNRNSDYKFEWSKLLALDGNTGPYLQYALVRIRSIFRTFGDNGWQHDGTPIVLQAPAELGLAKVLARMPDVLEQVSESCYPHNLCDHLYELARRFSVFYENCPVLQADDDRTRQSRLALCKVAAAQLELGLHCLGIKTLDRM